VAAPSALHPTFADPRRTLGYASYLSLFLFGLFNPVVQTMRQLCAVSDLKKVQAVTGAKRVSLGSFSEAQAVLEPDLLKQVFQQLVQQMPGCLRADPQLVSLKIIAQDGSLWRALPRMRWAEYGVGADGQAKGVRLHLRLNISKGCPEDALVTRGKGSETAALRRMLVAGQTTLADRLYGKSYKLMAEIDRARAFFIFRLHNDAAIDWEQGLVLSPSDVAAGVVRHGWAHLGATAQWRSMRVRVIEVQRDGHRLLLATNHPPEQVSAELAGALYRRRWDIELYFRWIKCVLGMRHFFAESAPGVALQIYLGLIAGLLLQMFTGRRPNRREMDLLQFYFLGWAEAEELARLISRYRPRSASCQKQ